MSIPAFLPPAPPEPRFCECGERLVMEMETDIGICVDCQAEAARESQTRIPQGRMSA